MKTIIDVEPKPGSARVRLQRRGRLLVAVPQKKLPNLTPRIVEQTRARLIKDRSAGK